MLLVDLLRILHKSYFIFKKTIRKMSVCNNPVYGQDGLQAVRRYMKACEVSDTDVPDRAKCRHKINKAVPTTTWD